MNKTRYAAAWLGGLTLALTAISAGAIEPALLQKCTICHGDEGISDEAAYPSIAGLPVKLQIDAMEAYKKGTRDCGAVPYMCNVTKELSDDQIKELAEHFVAFPFKPANQPFDAALVEKGRQLHEDYCEVCHGDSPANAEKSVLHGQWSEYLRYALTQYRGGHRKQPPSMRRQTEKLSDADIDALISFYASYR